MAILFLVDTRLRRTSGPQGHSYVLPHSSSTPHQGRGFSFHIIAEWTWGDEQSVTVTVVFLVSIMICYRPLFVYMWQYASLNHISSRISQTARPGPVGSDVLSLPFADQPYRSSSEPFYVRISNRPLLAPSHSGQDYLLALCSALDETVRLPLQTRRLWNPACPTTVRSLATAL